MRKILPSNCNECQIQHAIKNVDLSGWLRNWLALGDMVFGRYLFNMYCMEYVGVLWGTPVMEKD